MLKIILLLPLFITLLSSCTILSQGIAGSQKIQVRVWQNGSPDLLTEALNDTFALDVNDENILEFDVKTFGETIYVAYTTDQNIRTAKYPITTETLPGDLILPPPPLPPGVTRDVIYEFSKIETINTIRSVYSREITKNDVTSISDPILFDQQTQNKKGVWVRMFKGTLTGTANNPKLIWESIFVTDDPMEIGKIAILPLERQRATIVAGTDDSKIIVFNDVDQNGKINIIEDDLLRTPFKKIDQINTWEDGDKTYLSLVADNHIITGYYQNLIWFPTVDSDYKFNVKNMQVKMGSHNAYGVWMNDTKKELVVAIYQESTDISRRWLEIDTLSAIKIPILNVSTYKNSTGIHEDVYIGTINQNQDFFQLFNIRNLQTFYTGPIISGWNERYAITGNEAGQLLYVRSNFDQQLIFAGLNSFKQWGPIQLVSPPPVRVHPNSPIKVFFLNIDYSVTVFKQENGSIYFLGGVR